MAFYIFLKKENVVKISFSSSYFDIFGHEAVEWNNKAVKTSADGKNGVGGIFEKSNYRRKKLCQNKILLIKRINFKIKRIKD